MNKNEGKILGIIGGMGPLATNIFYQMIIDLTPAHKDQDHLNMIILSHATMPDRTNAIKTSNLSVLKNKLVEDAMFLESSGASCIAVPCNTSHVVLDEVQKEVGIPIVNMVRETVDDLSLRIGRQGDMIGVLATDGTIEAGIFQQELKKKGLIPVIPSKTNQIMLMKIIYDGIKAGNPVDSADFKQIEDELLRGGCKYIILACTELSCYAKMQKLSPVYVDAMEILARKVITICKS